MWICEICNEELLVGITERTGSGGSPQKPLQERILMLLWYMASLDKYASIADGFGVSESTACSAIRNLLQFITDLQMNKIIVWPNAAEIQEMRDLYMDLHNFPGVTVMIDSTHIMIRKPTLRERLLQCCPASSHARGFEIYRHLYWLAWQVSRRKNILKFWIVQDRTSVLRRRASFG